MSIYPHMDLIRMSLTGCTSISSARFNRIQMVVVLAVIKEEEVWPSSNQITKRLRDNCSIFHRPSTQSQEGNQSLDRRTVVHHPKHLPRCILPRPKLNSPLDKIQCRMSGAGHFSNHWIQNCCPKKHNKIIWRSQGLHLAPYRLRRSAARRASQITPGVQ